MRVNVLTARTPKAYNVGYPLRAFRRGLLRRGITLRFFYAEDDALEDCDVLCIVSEHRKQQRGDEREGAPLLDRLQRLRRGVSRLMWLDTSDSTGTTSFEVLPYVDVYAKNQLLRDRSRYTERFYGMRCYTDYYHKTRGITDDRESWRVPASPLHLHKLAVSWNLGLGSYVQRHRETISRLGRLRFYWPYAGYSWDRTSPNGDERALDASFRGMLEYGRDTLSFQRKETARRLADFAAQSRRPMTYSGRLPYREYREEMRRSKLVLSPFGFGEINAGRDFECFVDGAALVKPDMSHLTTWPDYFESGVTYAPYAWDFSNFEAVLEALLSDPAQRLRIAREGQARYLQSLSEEGERAFVDHFEGLLARTQAPADQSPGSGR